MTNYIIDTHCHLDFENLYTELDNILTRAKDLGVKKFITICVKIAEFKKILAIANKYENVYCAIGTHPNSAHEEQHVELEYIIEQCAHKKLVAIGETGLDYYYEKAAKDMQKSSFLKHIKAAQLTSLPLIIHTRNADLDTAEILKQQISLKKFNFVMHCYTSGSELAQLALQLGGYISFSGIATFKNAQQVRDIIKQVPLDRILIETDAPYLAPVPYRGKDNEPSYIVETAKYLAQYLEIEYQQFINLTTKNALQLFTKIKQ